jgi:hypothetical protein
MWDRSQSTKRLQREQKAIRRKAVRVGVEIQGRDLARLNRVRGSIQKYQYEDEYVDEDTYTERSDDDD